MGPISQQPTSPTPYIKALYQRRRPPPPTSSADNRRVPHPRPQNPRATGPGQGNKGSERDWSPRAVPASQTDIPAPGGDNPMVTGGTRRGCTCSGVPKLTAVDLTAGTRCRDGVGVVVWARKWRERGERCGEPIPNAVAIESDCEKAGTFSRSVVFPCWKRC
ncbi:hypothetical protein EJ06DRAFT_415361 [Trichodelitschia bisporula]|uniref:Uncharacterized protein n=1 Tax=Trichodelitschia bisporula TaxID=703511 RepID=A0A6G1HYI3_9PEZI|nr:hypothetical protein EJ06DRAFT_415361 [Trichodelitschia bisporula]